MESENTQTESATIRVTRWPNETALLFLVILASLGIWLMLAISIIGIVYVGMIGLFLFLARVSFIAHVRGSAVRLGPQQFPHLYERVVTLSRKAGLRETPTAYLMESGGSLNAFATRFFRARLIVLFSDLVDACENDEIARDMVIGHEIGHLHARHLDWWWLIAPGTLIPFLGSAYSRAREFTCDRYGAALCGDENGAVRGLTLLAAGGKHGPGVNLGAFVAQSEDLDTGWMTLAKWLAGYPPLCDRVAALQPSLAAGHTSTIRGPLRAALLLGALFILPLLALGFVFALLVPAWQRSLDALATAGAGIESVAEEATSTPFEGDVDAARAQVDRDFEEILAVIRSSVAEGRTPPADSDELDVLWREIRGASAPRDPFDDLQYGFYYDEEDQLVLWSSGADSEPDTDDDIARTFEVTASGAS